MGTDLVVLGQQDIVRGGLGLNSKIFSITPSTVEVVQKMTRAEGAVPGKLRITDTNQHFEEMQVVMLFEPVEQRAYFEGSEYTKDSKLCFSTDNVVPHDKAKIPQAMKCASCPKASWEKYRQTKERADLPKCKEYWHVVLADRVTQLPYYLNVRGTSIQPFIKAMKVLVKMIHLMKASAEAENEQIIKANPEVAAAVSTGAWHPLLKPMPNVFDVSFKLYVVPQDKGTYFTLGFKDIAPLKAEDRPKFGAIFLDFANRKAQGALKIEEEEAAAEAEAAEAEVATSFTEQPTGTVVEGEIVI